jgi:hypothetical protein
MDIALKKFLKVIESEERPRDLREVARWLKSLQMDGDTWEEISKSLCTAYGFKDDEDLAKNLGRPTFTATSDYVDDFSPLIDDIKLGGWIRDYIEYTRGMEAPTPFHFATALTLLGASLRRNIYIDFGYFKIWPAVQSMLVAPSGKGKKSTAAEFGVQTLLKIMELKLFNVLPDSGSGEALQTELSQAWKREKEATGLLYISEMATFIGKQDYNVNLIQMLTDLFDSRDAKRRRTSARGNEEMGDIAVSALMCSNPDWLSEAIPASAFGGGFFGRMLVFYQPDTDRIFPYPQAPDFREEVRLLEIVKRVSDIGKNGKQKATLTPTAMRWYDGRYRELKKNWPTDERLVPFWERYSIHLLRMAMLITISDRIKANDTPTEPIMHIHLDALEQADRLLGWILQYLPKVYRHVGGSLFGVDHNKIYEMILRHGGTMGDTELGRSMAHRMPRRTLKEHMDTLEKNGIVEPVRLDPWAGTYGWKIIRKMEE